jgi:hypothetical protein
VTINFADDRPTQRSSGIRAEGMRPAVRNGIEALRAMPPDARERQINSGRYDRLSPQDRALLKNASQSLRTN